MNHKLKVSVNSPTLQGLVDALVAGAEEARPSFEAFKKKEAEKKALSDTE